MSAILEVSKSAPQQKELDSETTESNGSPLPQRSKSYRKTKSSTASLPRDKTAIPPKSFFDASVEKAPEDAKSTCSDAALPAASALAATKPDPECVLETPDLQKSVFPVLARAGLGLSDKIAVTSVQRYLDSFQSECEGDPVERVLLNHIAVANLKIGELQMLATRETEFEKSRHYDKIGVQMLNAICQMINTLKSYRGANGARKSDQSKEPKTEQPSAK